MSGLDLNGRTALVSGAAKGLGEGMANALADVGANVMIGDLLDDLALETAAGLADGRGAAVHLDVTDEASWVQAINATIERFGGIDVLVNNAGIELSGLVHDVSADDLRRMFDVNVVGTTLGIKHAFKAMAPGGAAGNGGSVINIASVAATIAFPGIAGYSGSKSAVDRITRVAAMESGKLGFGVRVNCVYPGLVPTEMGQGLAADVVEMGLFPTVDEAIDAVVGLTPLGRLGEVADMADAVVFLASDQSRFITGAGLPVDGGMGM